ncbi:lysosome-associated membrane glycoprotein 3 isoform X2 [Microcaecilia unicolor]|uniref:Lysosome-associated membrane glycoprotein 3 isoform X2 n=1 Tax=Microcaecilia unicolor TaxID=1415580 RepID=A0A6P7Z511_9AMPH|nr:lysosome-associated membrane glycoprotein 3 isoform X2 [Microcaecilia unicolor]
MTTRETVGPTLSPVPSPPPVLNYSVTQPNSSTNCIQASMGLELIVLNSDESEDSYYISEIEAVLKVSPQGMLYNGNITNQQLFKTSLGYSFKCASKQTVMLAHNFQFRTVYTQLQAFSINNNKFGKVSQCSADHNIVPVAVGVMVVILIVLGLIIYGIYLKCKSDGYQRI